VEANLAVVIGEEDLRRRVRELGAEISRDYAGRTPVLVSVLKGSFMFLADLARAITVPVNLDFMAITLRHEQARRRGPHEGPRSGHRPRRPVRGGHRRHRPDPRLPRAQSQAAAGRLAVCTLLDRRVRRLANLPIRYVGFEVADRFLVGYGLDHHEKYRNLPYLAALPEEPGGPRPRDRSGPNSC
jgi:hypoxanthine phosphoribosyltransferase